MDSYKADQMHSNSSRTVDVLLVMADKLTKTATGVFGEVLDVGTGFVSCDTVIDVMTNTATNILAIEGSYTKDFISKIILASHSFEDGAKGRYVIPIRNSYADEAPYPYIRANLTVAGSGSPSITATVFLAKN